MSTSSEETTILGFFVYHLDDDLDELDDTHSFLTKPILLARYLTSPPSPTYTIDDDDEQEDGDDGMSRSHETSRKTIINELFLSRSLAEDPPDPVATLNHLGGIKIVQATTAPEHAHQLVYGADSLNLCLVVVTSLSYPPKYAMQLLQEWYGELKRDVPERLLTFNNNNDDKSNEERPELAEQLHPICTALLGRFGNIELLLQKQRDREERAANQRRQNDPFAFADEESETEHLTPFDIEQTHFVDENELLRQRVKRRKFFRKWTFRCCMLIFVVAIILPIVFVVLRQKETYEEQREELEEEFEREKESGDLPFPEALDDDGATRI